ncbi:MAG TPA: hypothetical protein VFJ25_04635 [Casimicrobiaceae bacterium]|nr:hypothetical protein [Casimicrobiaceae bacterium]
MIAIKPGVRIRGLAPEILLAINVAHELYREQAQSLTITSGTDGQHMAGSLHHAGLAVDLRLPATPPERMIEQLKIRLGAEYDVVLEGDHIHVEYDPKHA